MIHRDIKPENMLFGLDDRVVLSDFGIALEQASLAVQDVPSVQLNSMALSTPPGAPIVPVPPLQNTPQSSQTEIEQEQPLSRAPEMFLENGEAYVEALSQIHADSSSLLADEKETVPPESNHMLNAPHSQAAAFDSLNAVRSGTEISTAKTSDETVNPWSLGKRQMIAMVIGIVMYSIHVYFIDPPLAANYHGNFPLWDSLFPGGLYLSWANILRGLIIVVPLFFATKFGPWVGLACILLVALIGDSFSRAITDFPLAWYDFASLALLGFLSGLAFLRTQGRYNTRRNLATAIVTSFIGLVMHALFLMTVYIIVYQSNWFDYYSFRFTLATVLVVSIVTLILLPLLLLIFNNIESHNAPTV